MRIKCISSGTSSAVVSGIYELLGRTIYSGGKMSTESAKDLLPDRIYDTFQKKTIMVTGGMGYVGKVYIEALLRVFDVAKIYVLIRAKKGLQPSERLSALFTSPLFDKVRNLKGDGIFDKCVVVSGDVTLDNLGISEEDRLVIQREVEIVIHSAATVRFDETLKTAININTKGTYLMLELAKGMKQLLVFVHVSTAYCHWEEKELLEKFYATIYNPIQLTESVNRLDDKSLEVLSNSLLRDVPNTYVFSKALAEDLVASAINDLPVIVVRPSIVMPIWKEPLPGWCDNLNGPMGIMTAAGKGVCRSMLGNRDAKVDFTSVDIVIDAICLTAAYAIREGFEQRVFNICSNKELELTWGEFIDVSKRIGMRQISFDVGVWAPGGDIRRNVIVHYVVVLFAQLIPALILDSLMWCFGHKPFLWRIQMRLAEGVKVFRYYTSGEWTFNNDALIRAREWMNARERNAYNVTNDGVDLEDYANNAILATRRYILKEPDENLPKAKRMMKVMVWIDKICNVLLKVLLAYLLYKWILLKIYNHL